jgi:PAS domain S-box-containing protein
MYTLLYIDDEIDLHDVARMYLEETGMFRVDTAVSTRQAQDMVAVRKYDAIICDYQMPGQDGIEFLKHIRQNYGNIPFILFTGKGREDVVIEAINNGADYYLQKGGDPDSLFAEMIHKLRLALRRRETDEELQQSEEKFSQVFLFNPAVAAISTIGDGEFIDVNEAFLTTTGYTREEVIGQTAADLDIFWDPESRERLASRIRQENTIKNVETPIRTKSGEKRILLFSGKIIRVGTADYLYTNAIDITERTMAEEAIEDSARHLAEIIRFLPDATFAIDKNGTVILWNHAIEEMTGVPATGILGKNNYEYSLPFYGIRRPILIDLVFSPRDEVEKKYSFVNVDGDVLTAEAIDATPRGKNVILWGKAAPLYDREGNVTGAIESIRDITDRRRAETDLSESEHRNAILLDAIPDMMFVITRDGIYRDFNVPDSVILALPADQIIGKNICETGFNPEAVSAVMQHIADAITSKKLQMFEYNLTVMQDIRTYEARMVALNDVEVLAIVRDITERKRTEEALRWKTTFFESLANASPDGILTVDSKAQKIHINQRLTDLWNIPQHILDDPSDEPLLRYVVSLTRFPESFYNKVKYLYAHPEKVSRDEIEFKDGRIFDRYTSPVLGTDGKYYGRIWTFHDITGRKSAEKNLQKSEERLSRAEVVAHSGNWEFHFESGMVQASEGAKELYGLGGRDWRISEVQQIPLPSYRPMLDAAMSGLVEKRQPYNVEFEIKRPTDGSVLWIHSIAEYDPENRVVFGTMQDITDRKKAEEALHQANRKLNLLASISRHDILNKVTVILGNLKLLKRFSEDTEFLRMTGRIDAATKAIKTQLEFSKLYQGLGSKEPLWQDLHRMIRSLQIPEEIRLTAEVQGIEILADPMLEMVFNNFLDNSIRHGQHVTMIRVFADKTPEGISLIWEDNGTGIPPDEKEQIFEGESGKPSAHGLFLVREILAITSIRIRENGKEGTGARFEISVPRNAYRRGRQT